MHRLALLLAFMGATVSACAPPYDLCRPVDGRVGFFSRGDCVLTRASFFSGHEWLTTLGNDMLPADTRFSAGELGTIVNGNRRVDYPKELLVHLSNGAIAYATALQDYHDRPENQPLHFLLDANNDTPGAAALGHARILMHTQRALAQWHTSRRAALTDIGRACHTIEDSFSAAHTRRETEVIDDEGHVSQPTPPADDCTRLGVCVRSCVRKVKAYMPRDHHDDGVEFHGGDDESTVGHTTSQDSIYREGRDCNDPTTRGEVESCLSIEARRARNATAHYLRLLLTLIAERAEAEAIERALNDYFTQHIPLCQGL